jgi:hypothetical protein
LGDNDRPARSLAGVAKPTFGSTDRACSIATRHWTAAVLSTRSTATRPSVVYRSSRCRTLVRAALRHWTLRGESRDRGGAGNAATAWLADSWLRAQRSHASLFHRPADSCRKSCTKRECR